MTIWQKADQMDASKIVGFIKVKTIDKAKEHRKINIDLYRLGIFAKEASDSYKLKHTFQSMAIGKFIVNVIERTYSQPFDIFL